MLLSSIGLSVLGSAQLASAALDLAWGDDSDLTSFVTRPEIRLPRFNITVYDSAKLAPGYWFVAPYTVLDQEVFPPKYYQPCQIGPAIYDGAGELVWSGACLLRNNNTCDFRPYRENGRDALSAVLCNAAAGMPRKGLLFDDSYSIMQEVNSPPNIRDFNMHELKMLDDGNKALHFMGKSQSVDASVLHVDLQKYGLPEGAKFGWVVDIGFREMDVATGDTLFEWWSTKHVPITESDVKIEDIDKPFPAAWDYFHGNSINKNDEGDYLLSGRFTNCIYKISGKDGHVIWRLGGKSSDFVLEGFNFSRQHDAHWLDFNDKTETVAFLNNAGDSINQTSSFSSALVVKLDKTTKPMTARVVLQIDRPDKGRTKLRGNVQHLPNGNILVGWSENSYLSEHDSTGRLLMEAEFQSKRTVTYRSYKSVFKGNPSEKPVLKAFAFGQSPAKSTTVYYVSWNGATEVAKWRFSSIDTAKGREIFHGTTRKTGFETVFHCDGYHERVYAEALAADGSTIGHTRVFTVKRPKHWDPVDAQVVGDAFRFGTHASPVPQTSGIATVFLALVSITVFASLVRLRQGRRLRRK